MALSDFNTICDDLQQVRCQIIKSLRKGFPVLIDDGVVGRLVTGVEGDDFWITDPHATKRIQQVYKVPIIKLLNAPMLMFLVIN